MSAVRPSKRPATNPKDATSPLTTFTPKSQTSGNTPSGIDISPERAPKRARTDYSAPSAESNRDVKRETRTEGRIGKGRGGAVWVHEKVSELEGMYKECIVAATLLLQYKSYSHELGLGTKNIPTHSYQRVEKAWMAYTSLRSHVETYLLKCAQSANSPSETLPTPSSLVPGQPPLPPIPSIPIKSSTLLSLSPHPGKMGSVSLDKLLSADPGKGLMGYEKGQMVFPGVPTDIAMPEPDIPLPIEKNEEVIIEEPMPISLPGVDYPTGDIQQGGVDMGLGDLDLDSMGIAELSALINGDISSLNGGDTGGGGGQQMETSVFTPETAAMLGNINMYTSSSNQVLLPTNHPPSVPQQPTLPQQPPPVQAQSSAQIVDQSMIAAFDQSQHASIPPPVQKQIIPQPQFTNPQTVHIPSQSNPIPSVPIPAPPPQPVQPPQQSLPPPSTTGFDFDFSTLDGMDSLDNIDSLADIDFNELAGMFGGPSGRTTRAPSPSNAIPSSAQVPEQLTGLGLGGMGTGGSEIVQSQSQVADFDGSLGAINLDEFDFADRDEEGGMPGVDGDEFESMFAEFK